MPENPILDAPLPALQTPISERDRQTLQRIATSDVLIEAPAYLERLTKTPLAEKDQVVYDKGDHQFAARQFSSKVFDGFTIQFALPYHATTAEARDLYDRAIKITDPQLLNEGWVARIEGADAIAAWKVKREIQMAEMRAEIRMGRVLNAHMRGASGPKFLTPTVNPTGS